MGLGEDGLSKDFFTDFWEEVKKLLFLVFQRISSGGRMPEFFGRASFSHPERGR